MNRENIQKVRDHIASLPPERLDMYNWFREAECGTVCCIGGWTNLVLGPDEPRERWSVSKARGRLDISYTQADELFFGAGVSSAVGPAQAVAVLDHLLETGEVDWSIIGGEA